jgi:hypothetical protein
LAVNAQDQDTTTVSLPRVSVDFKIPLWGIMGAAAIFLTGLASMYMQVGRVAEDVLELKAYARTANGTTLEFAKAQARLEARIERVEEQQKEQQREKR